MTTASALTVVVDTNILIHRLSNKPSDQALVDRYRPHIDGRAVSISFQTQGELLVGREMQNWDPQRFDSLMRTFTVVEWSERLLACYVRIRAAAIDRWNRGEGPKIDAADGWIAAAALLLGRPLVTHDERLSKCPLIETITELAS